MSVPAVRRIVAGVDGSSDSVIALRWACREAAIRGAEVHAVHVCEGPLHSPASYAVPAPEDTCGLAEDDAEMWKAALADLPRGITVRTESAVGLVARVLLDRCRGADMLVLGTGSDAAGQAWPAGPVIRACLRRSPCPVVVISAELEGAWGYDAGDDIAPREMPATVAVGAAAISPTVVSRDGLPVGVGA
jgi:nucleotide-binding universal stress UspA family protein